VTEPMRLPGAECARIPTDKLVRYALDPDHPRGRHKARVFAWALGIRRRAHSSRSATTAGTGWTSSPCRTTRLPPPAIAPASASLLSIGQSQWITDGYLRADLRQVDPALSLHDARGDIVRPWLTYSTPQPVPNGQPVQYVADAEVDSPGSGGSSATGRTGPRCCRWSRAGAGTASR
jgi:hypothetical protein